MVKKKPVSVYLFYAIFCLIKKCNHEHLKLYKKTYFMSLINTVFSGKIILFKIN